MKNLSIGILIFLLVAPVLVVMVSCQASSDRALPIDVTSDDTSSPDETLVPTLPPPSLKKEAGTNNGENPHKSFPYEKIEGFGEVEYGKLSGIVFHPQRNTLFAVSDNGRVIEMKTDGSVIQQK